MSKTLNYLLAAFLGLAFSGCVPYEKLVSYQTGPEVGDSIEIKNSTKIRIQPDDVLRIKVYTADEATAAPFNLTPTSSGDDFVSIESIQLSGYLVGKDGTIDFPVLGTLKVEGMTIAEIKGMVAEKLLTYVKDPVVNVRLLNFRVTVAGEVRNPGSFFVINERITLPEALTLAGDVTNYADRANVLVVREENGIRTFHRVNLQSSALFQSDVFYLKQNDFINVDPIEAKTGAVQDQTNKTLPIVTAAATLIAVVVSIVTK